MNAMESEAIREDTEQVLAFNVLPGRPVRELLRVREYRLGPRRAVAIFDREYSSSMASSPDHLIFVSVLVHSQKLLYALLCRELGLAYDPHGPEVLKIWPVRVDTAMPRMIRKRRGLVQTMHLSNLRPEGGGRYFISMETDVEGVIRVSSDCAVYRL